MTELLVLTQETWGTTYPTWDALVSYKDDLATFGFEPLEWRMHPKPYAEMMRSLPVSAYVDDFASERRMLGAPLVLDANIEESRARCLVRVEGVSLR